MTLQHELSTLPDQALTVLMYMSQDPTGSSDVAQMKAGTGLTDRSLGKALKRLVTRHFLSMNASRFYSLTPKGTQALEMMGSGIIDTSLADNSQKIIDYDLCAVIPAQVPASTHTAWMIGLNPIETASPKQSADIYLRITAYEGYVSPSEFTLRLSAEQPIVSTQVQLMPVEGYQQLRIQVETYQMFELDEPRWAGGMYFDITVGSDTGPMRAIHIPIDVI